MCGCFHDTVIEFHEGFATKFKMAGGAIGRKMNNYDSPFYQTDVNN